MIVNRNLSKAEEKAFQDWLKKCDSIKKATVPIQNESSDEKQDRIKRLVKDFESFCNYYFPHYCNSPFGWFHRKAAKDIEKDKTILACLEWPREHAKSVFIDVLLPLYLKVNGEFTGMILGSANETKAKILLSDIQAEMSSNERFINDFGKQVAYGSWLDGHFVTTDGLGFWAFGRGQSPRGVRVGENRPNFGVIDDIDDKVIVKNEERVDDALNWILGDFFGCMPLQGSRLIVAGNRIHKKSILAKFVGDIDSETPKRDKLYHLKVYALEDSKRRKSSAGDPDARPAWKERYTMAMLTDRFQKMGSRNASVEYFHEHREEGFTFKDTDIHWGKVLPLDKYLSVVVYIDPSFRDSKKNDFKAIVLIGFTGRQYHIIKAWVRQASVSSMVKVTYDIAEEIRLKYPNARVRYYMEANFIQDIHLAEFENEGETRLWQLPIAGDYRKKTEKTERIEALHPLFEQGKVIFNEDEKKSKDMIELKDQFIGFPFAKDDGPDAVEGGIFKCGLIKYGKPRPMKKGAYVKNRDRG